MATAPTSPLVSVEEYLNTSYEHDMEYVDGMLVKREMPTIAHSLLQKLLLFWFAGYEKAIGFIAIQEVRIQIIAGSKYRLPDVMLCSRPLPKGNIYDAVPWAVIEILSPDDTWSDTQDRFLDYAGLGVQNLALMDPEKFLAYRFEKGSFIQERFQDLRIADRSSIPFDSGELFRQLRDELSVE